MRAPGTVLIALPRQCWESKVLPHEAREAIRRFLGDLGDIERRIGKGVAVDDERKRYTRLLTRIEQVALGCAKPVASRGAFRAALRSKHALPAIRVSSAYTDFLRMRFAAGDLRDPLAGRRLGASLFSPQVLKTHASALAQLIDGTDFAADAALRHRQWFVEERVLPARSGLLEVPEPLGVPMCAEATVPAEALDGRSWWTRVRSRWSPAPRAMLDPRLRRASVAALEGPLPPSGDWVSYRPDDRGTFMVDRLRAQIETAMSQGVPVNLSNQRHNMFTEIFAEFICKRPGSTPGNAPLVYGDGRAVDPFPLRVLDPLPDGWTPTRILHVGLVSMRHLPLDRYIDVNWYRNAEVPSRSGLAGADAWCTRVSRAQLKRLLDLHKGQRLRLHVYHSGYMPAVVGFYRAVVEVLGSGTYERGCLQVLPMLQPKDDGFRMGAGWPS